MHGPRDAFERDLYGAPNASVVRTVPGWRFLALTIAVYAVSVLLVAYVRVAEVGGSELQSLFVFGGLLVVLGSGLLAGWLLLATGALLSKLRAAAE